MQILSLIRNRFFQALTGWIDQPEEYASRVSIARDPQHGDYQANIAMPLQKTLNLPPREIANQLVSRLSIGDLCHEAEVAGPGFINLRLRDSFLAEQLAAAAQDSRLGVGCLPSRTFVIDYSAPNVAKPMHVGHIRSTVIGDALARILRFLGHQVITDNHLGDWGTQFGMIIYGYKHFVDPVAFHADPVVELSRLYRLVQSIIAYQNACPKLEKLEQGLNVARKQAAEAEAAAKVDSKQKKVAAAALKALRSAEDNLAAVEAIINGFQADPKNLTVAQQHPDLETQAQLETAKLHQGDAENLALWERFLPISIAEIESVYRRLDIHFDHTLGESFYHPLLSSTVQSLLDAKMAVESEGAICIFLEGFDAPMLIRKRDGAFLYATTDLATIEYRQREFQPDVILYVVDHRQSEHFQKLFAAARACGYTDIDLQHISFGTVLGPDGKPFKTRSGAVIGLEYLLDEAIQRAHQVVCDPQRMQKAGLEMSAEESQEVARVVGLGAIKYADLSHNRTSDYEFNTEKMVQLEGNTSAYIQYMYARIQSIIRKSGEQLDQDSIAHFAIQLTESAERSLALQLLQFEDALLQSLDEYYPSVLTTYLYTLAKQFASFFDQCHVLNADSEEVRRSRLAICFTTGRVLKQGLGLLGIGVVDRM
ncbi:MAG: arginine--tRNA ligase [Planctomycetales bacterium]|nr:arginine--tRNA ligase [Planctomycetales bacterium]